MQQVQMTPTGLQYVQQALDAPEALEQVYETDGTDQFMKYSAIRIVRVIGGYRVEFIWGPDVLFSSHISGALEVGNSMTLGYLEGRMKLTVEL